MLFSTRMLLKFKKVVIKKLCIPIVQQIKTKKWLKQFFKTEDDIFLKYISKNKQHKNY